MKLGVDLGTGTKTTCLTEIGLSAENKLSILGSILNMIMEGGDLYDCLMSTLIFTFDDEQDIT